MKSGRAPGPRRRRWAITASWVAWSSPCSIMSTTRMAGPSASSPASRAIRASDIGGAVLEEPGQGPVDPRFERRVGVQPRPRRRGAIRRALQAQEGGIGQGLGQALGQPRLAAAQRADDVGQWLDVVQLEPLAAPGPGEVEGDAAGGGRRRKARQLRDGRRPALREVAPEAAELLHHAGKLAEPGFEHGLVRRQGGLQTLGVALQHAGDLGEAEAERAQGRDLGGARHLGGAIGPPSRRAADRGDEATLLVEAQRLDGHPKPTGGFGRRSGMGRKSSRLTSLPADRPLIGAVPGAGSRGKWRPPLRPCLPHRPPAKGRAGIRG